MGFMVSQRGIEAYPDKIQAILDMEPSKSIKEVQSLTGQVAALNRFVSKATDKCLPFFKVLRKAFEWTDECQRAFQDLKNFSETLLPNTWNSLLCETNFFIGEGLAGILRSPL